ncbi:hypothetical protein ZOSMA_29G00380 [Zostera marina]|uniref:Uncharacterized protein n=1 Tax=Zostera marina TaxID=29655 RepID=A0A0K9PBN2_ZOSMR|nr:hypothetical protein ZOSMA_29G00380 [Zostera marina]
MDVNVKSFRSKCSSDEFVATFEVETKMETEILEKSVQRVMNNAHLGYNPMCKKY